MLCEGMVNLCRECKLIRFTLLGGGLSEARAFPEPGTLPELGGAPEPGRAFRSIPGARRSLRASPEPEPSPEPGGAFRSLPGARRSLPGAQRSLSEDYKRAKAR